MLTPSSKTDLWRALLKGFALFSVGASVALSAQDFHSDRDKYETNFRPGNLVVSRSVYDKNPNNAQTPTQPSLPERNSSPCGKLHMARFYAEYPSLREPAWTTTATIAIN